MNKFEKRIARNSQFVDKQIKKFASTIDETKRAIEAHDETITDLNSEKQEIERLIEVTKEEKSRAEKFLESISSLIK